MKITVNGQLMETAAETTIAALLEQMNWKGRQVAVEVNLELVPRAQHSTHVLREGDQLEVVTLVGGG